MVRPYHGVIKNKEKIELMEREKPTDKYKSCNHHHEVKDNHQLVDFGDGEFVANNEAIPLLKALNDLNIRTRTHHIDKSEHGFFSILLDSRLSFEIRKVYEGNADRTKYNGETELLISW